MRRSRRGIMAAELAFLLLILIVLGGLMASVYLKTRREPERTPAVVDPIAAHQARYLRYLSYVREQPNAEGGSQPVAEDDRSVEREPRAAREPDDASQPSFAAGPDAPAAPSPSPVRPLSVLAGSGSLSGSSAAQGAGASASLEAPVDDTASVLAASPSFRAASTPADEESVLEVTVANVGGNPAAPAPSAGGSGGSSAGGTFLVGAGPGGAPAQNGSGRDGSPPGSGSLVLIAVPADENAPSETAGPAESGGGDSGSTVHGHGRGVPLRRVEFQHRGTDRWRQWPDANFRNIVGDQGTDALNRAFELLQNSDAESIAADLFRKGIPILFGKAEDFSQPGAPAAMFTYPDSRPPDAPIPPPILTFNPKFLHEDPRVLAAVLAHEGTHFQQYLDGTLDDGSADETALETEAWNNGASAWQEVRRSAIGLNTPLVRDLEVGYQVARQGEGLLRDFVAALYAHDR